MIYAWYEETNEEAAHITANMNATNYKKKKTGFSFVGQFLSHARRVRFFCLVYARRVNFSSRVYAAIHGHNSTRCNMEFRQPFQVKELGV